MNIIPAQIFEKYKNREVDRLTVKNLLSSIIENEDDDIIRIDAIKILSEINLNDVQNFNLLENILMSDSNDGVRIEAAKTLISLFPVKCIEPLEYIVKSESSALVLKPLYDLFEKVGTTRLRDLKRIIISRFARYIGVIEKEAKFFLDFMGFNAYDNVECCKIIDDSIIEGRSENFDDPDAWLVVRENHIVMLSLERILKDTIPESISLLKKLEILYLGQSDFFTTLPHTIDKLESLDFIDLSYCRQLKKIPQSLFELAKQRLAKKYIEKGVLAEEAPVLGLFEMLIGRKLENINKEKSEKGFFHYRLNDVGNVVGLYLYGNEYGDVNFCLFTIPSQIKYLKYLKEFRVLWNGLKELPKSLRALSSLKELVLDYNQFEDFPVVIMDLPSLRILSLKHNYIQKIPQFFENQKNLEILDLSNNHIKELPDSIGNLKSLISLGLEGNNIKELPESMKNLESLEFLYLGKDQIKKLPEFVLKLKKVDIERIF